jgi:hypothetical protein
MLHGAYPIYGLKGFSCLKGSNPPQFYSFETNRFQKSFRYDLIFDWKLSE